MLSCECVRACARVRVCVCVSFTDPSMSSAFLPCCNVGLNMILLNRFEVPHSWSTCCGSNKGVWIWTLTPSWWAVLYLSTYFPFTPVWWRVKGVTFMVYRVFSVYRGATPWSDRYPDQEDRQPAQEDRQPDQRTDSLIRRTSWSELLLWEAGGSMQSHPISECVSDSFQHFVSLLLLLINVGLCRHVLNCNY